MKRCDAAARFGDTAPSENGKREEKEQKSEKGDTPSPAEKDEGSSRKAWGVRTRTGEFQYSHATDNIGFRGRSLVPDGKGKRREKQLSAEILAVVGRRAL